MSCDNIFLGIETYQQELLKELIRSVDEPQLLKQKQLHFIQGKS